MEEMKTSLSNSQFWMTDEERAQCFGGREEMFRATFVELQRDDNRALTLVQVRAALSEPQP